MADFFNNYDLGGFYDEMFSAPGVPRPHYRQLMERYGEMSGIGEMFTLKDVALKEISELRKQLESCDIKVVLGNGLHEFLDDIQSHVAAIHAATQTCFVNYDPVEAAVV